MRIGELAKAAGTTVRTVRYYEEIGLLAGAEDRGAGAHRTYDEHDVEHVAELLRLKDLLGLSLDELRELNAAQAARPELRAEFHAPGTGRRRRAAILREALGHLEHQRALVARRRAQLDELDAELDARRARVLSLLDDVGASTRV